MNNKTVWILLATTIAGAIIASGFSYWEHQSLVEVRAQVRSGELQPIAGLLKDNQALIKDLESQSLNARDAGILESYLAMVRHDGVAKHADTKHRLDQLAENNTAIVTLIKAYAPHTRTPAFTSEADKFRNYASAWRDRWNSVMELFMAGGNCAASEVPFPNGFPGAVHAEIAASR